MQIIVDVYAISSPAALVGSATSLTGFIRYTPCSFTMLRHFADVQHRHMHYMLSSSMSPLLDVKSLMLRRRSVWPRCVPYYSHRMVIHHRAVSSSTIQWCPSCYETRQASEPGRIMAGELGAEGRNTILFLPRAKAQNRHGDSTSATASNTVIDISGY
nr:hypothetical protein CFP56_22397 [Quercus suber]